MPEFLQLWGFVVFSVFAVTNSHKRGIMISKILEITIPFVVSARISHYNDLRSKKARP